MESASVLWDGIRRHAMLCLYFILCLQISQVETKKAEPRYASSGGGYSGYHQQSHHNTGYMQGALQNGTL